MNEQAVEGADRGLRGNNFTLGGAVYGLGVNSDGSQIRQSQVDEGVSEARRQGWKSIDLARLYGATKGIGRALENLSIDHGVFDFSTKVGRSLVRGLRGAEQHQPERLTRCRPSGYKNVVDCWGFSPNAIATQLTTEAELLGIDGKIKRLLHDIPDAQTQLEDFDWSRHITNGALEYLVPARDEFDFIDEIGLGTKAVSSVGYFMEQEPGVLNTAGVTFCPIVTQQFMDLLEMIEQSDSAVTVHFMGILWGGAFGCRSDPRAMIEADPTAWLFNYEPPTDDQITEVCQWYDIITKGGMTMVDFSAAVTGQFMKNWPEVFTRAVLGSLKGRQFDLADKINTVDIKKAVRDPLVEAGLFPADFPWQ